MKKYFLLFISLLLLTGCGKKNSELETDKEYQKDYITAIAVFKGLMNYEYDMVIEEGETSKTRNVKHNKQGEFTVIKDPEIKEVADENGQMILPKNAISYLDTQMGKSVSYDTVCGRGWTYEPITLTSDSNYGPYAQFLALTNAEKITKFENNTYFLEVDARDVKDAISNNQFTYDGKINMEVNIENDLFKTAVIRFGDTKVVKLNFIDYANVSAMMDAEAQAAPRYLGGC